MKINLKQQRAAENAQIPELESIPSIGTKRSITTLPYDQVLCICVSGVWVHSNECVFVYMHVFVCVYMCMFVFVGSCIATKF